MLCNQPPLLRAFIGRHPSWEDVVLLYADGRCERAGVDWANCELEEGKRILLNWDRWPAEELHWDADRRLYRAVSNGFTLSEAPVLPLRVNYANFWNSFDRQAFERGLGLGDEPPLVQSDRPQVVFESVFGESGAGRRRWRAAKQLWFTGENRTPPLEKYDACLSFFRDIDDRRHFRWPIFLYHLQTIGKSLHDLCKPLTNMPPVHERPRFCAFIASNASCHTRNAFVQLLSSHRRVDCPGAVLNNMPSEVVAPPGDFQAKIEFLKNYQFAVCFENQATCGGEGYVTEKIVDAMLAGCIPLYWGDHRVGEDFNCECFVNLSRFGSDVRAMVQHVVAIDQDDRRLRQIAGEPWLVNNEPPQQFQPQHASRFIDGALRCADSQSVAS